MERPQTPFQGSGARLQGTLFMIDQTWLRLVGGCSSSISLLWEQKKSLIHSDLKMSWAAILAGWTPLLFGIQLTMRHNCSRNSTELTGPKRLPYKNDSSFDMPNYILINSSYNEIGLNWTALVFILSWPDVLCPAFKLTFVIQRYRFGLFSQWLDIEKYAKYVFCTKSDHQAIRAHS